MSKQLVKIKWISHASFLIEGDGLRIITDPYEPNKIINLPPITEQADIVIRSSDDDVAHAFVGTLPPGYELVTATDIVDTGITVRGLKIDAIESEESRIHKKVVGQNAMYRFTLGGINIAHMGDIGNPLTPAQLDFLAGTDILLALTGGPPTIDLDDLHNVIAIIKPKIIIPMHYRIPGPRFFMLPITEFTAKYPASMVEWSDHTDVDLNKVSLPTETRILVLKPTLFKNE